MVGWFQQCTACNALIHPPAPVCRTCRSSDSAVTEVSGLGRLIGFTVNHRMRLPGLEPPYVVGHVAIEEDDRVRLTTRIVDADPDDLRLGQQVRVVFEHVEDVYLPLFTPTGEPGLIELPRDEIEPQDMRRHVRAPVSSRRFEADSAITGIGTSQIGRRLMRDPLSLTVDACRAAVEDAGLRFEDIDGLSTYPGGSSAGGMGEGGVSAFARAGRTAAARRSARAGPSSRRCSRCRPGSHGTCCVFARCGRPPTRRWCAPGGCPPAGTGSAPRWTTHC